MSTMIVSRRALSVVAQAVLAASTLACLPSVSMAQEQEGYRLYRCAVLGDSQACPRSQVLPAVRVESLTTAGPYARYLMYLGQDPSHAIEAARAIGEVPVLRTVRITTRQLTSLESYERYQGRLATPSVKSNVLAEVPIEAPILQACFTACGPASGKE
jgi:hypothetical protein